MHLKVRFEAILTAFLFAVSLAILSCPSALDAKPSRPLLRGVTIRNWPYADRLNDRYEGFVIDLMNMISSRVGFAYQMYFSPDKKYGSEHNGSINGMIGEVHKNKADFAIADLTVTDARKQFVDFTEPFLENQLSAIIRREDSIGLRTLEDLVTLNEINRASAGTLDGNGHYLGSSSSGIAFGTYRTGSTFYHLSRSRDPIAVRMYTWMLRNQHALVGSAREGFDRVNAGRYAFIVESTFAEYLSGLYCNLATLYDTRSLYPRQFAIALPKGSPYLEPFNRAIREMKASGEIDRLRQMYWANRCGAQNSATNNVNSAKSAAVAPTASNSDNGSANNNIAATIQNSVISTSSSSASSGAAANSATHRGNNDSDDDRQLIGNSIDSMSNSARPNESPAISGNGRHRSPALNTRRTNPNINDDDNSNNNHNVGDTGSANGYNYRRNYHHPHHPHHRSSTHHHPQRGQSQSHNSFAFSASAASLPIPLTHLLLLLVMIIVFIHSPIIST